MKTPAATRLLVTPIPGEMDRFFVQSKSRPDVEHVVDMQFQSEPYQKPHAACGCEQNFIKGKPCDHIAAVREAVQELTEPDYTEEDFEVMP